MTPFPTAAFPAVDALLKKHLKPKHAAQFAALMQEPCESFNVGVILNLVQMRNTNAAFAAFTTAALAELDAPSVAGVWARTPRRAQVWLLKSFVAALPFIDRAAPRLRSGLRYSRPRRRRDSVGISASIPTPQK